MTANYHTENAESKPELKRLRAIVEIVDGELKVYPIADTDEQAREIMDSLLLRRAGER